ncbi:unnamed protein product [Prunus armeniaca]
MEVVGLCGLGFSQCYIKGLAGLGMVRYGIKLIPISILEIGTGMIQYGIISCQS